MPNLTIWTIRAALINLLVGFTIGALILANKGYGYWPQTWSLLPVHIEFLLVGWMLQFCMGVAYWILPRFPGGVRGKTGLAVAALSLLNLGVVLAVFQLIDPLFLMIGRVCEVLAGIFFALHAWGRIRPLYPSSSFELENK